MGLDKPLIVQFISYVADIAQGHFGMSVSTGRPVIEDLSRFFPATLEMATIGIIIGVLLGVPMGVYRRQPTGYLARSDHSRFRSAFGYSVPAFWLGLVGLAVFYAHLGWVGGPGRLDIYYDGLIRPVTGLILVDSLLAGEAGDLFQRHHSPHPCRPRSSAFSAWPISRA